MFRTIFFTDICTRSLLRLGTDAQGVGTHIGNQTLCSTVLRAKVDTFVQLLCDTHDTLGLKTKLAGCLLLHGGGRERRCRQLISGGFFHLAHDKGMLCCGFCNCHGVIFVAKAYSASPISDVVHGKGTSAIIRTFQLCVNCPIFLRNESADLLLTLDNHTLCDRLHTARTQATLYVFPEQRTDLITYDTVKNTARLLRVDLIHIQRTGRLDGSLDSGFGDLIEGDAHDLLRGDAEHGGQMPGNRLPLAVRVGCQINTAGSLCLLADVADQIASAADVDIMRFKIVFNIHSQGALGQVAHVPFGGNDAIIGAKVALDCSDLVR